MCELLSAFVHSIPGAFLVGAAIGGVALPACGVAVMGLFLYLIGFGALPEKAFDVLCVVAGFAAAFCVLPAVFVYGLRPPAMGWGALLGLIGAIALAIRAAVG